MLDIAAHLQSVEYQLRAKEMPHLESVAAGRREALLDVLHDYWERGVFPHNHNHPEGETPVFVDEHGSLCAVGAMLAASGHHELVAQVVELDVHARVAQLDVDDWAAAHGFSPVELALIQPSYGPYQTEPASAYLAGSGFLDAAILGTSWGVMSGNGADWLPALDLGLGVAAVAMGVARWSWDRSCDPYYDDDVCRTDHTLNKGAARANVVLGAAGISIGAWGLAQQEPSRWLVGPSGVTWSTRF
jgi:hypothetical protein